jgi:hypothetical protein
VLAHRTFLHTAGHRDAHSPSDPPEGVTAVFHGIGGGLAEFLVAALRPRGAMVLDGSPSGGEAQISAKDLSNGSVFFDSRRWQALSGWHGRHAAIA